MYNPIITRDMGLDIFFYKFKKADWEMANELKEAIANEPDDEKANKMIDEANEMLPDIQTKIGSFRKVNFLMAFFNYTDIDEDDCEYKEVSRKQLQELKDRCARIITQHGEGEEYTENDIALAKELLPTQSGFLWGSTEYDKWYFADVKEVLEWVNGVLDALGDDEVITIQPWW